ncbi:DUF302 domain-containing protein [Marinobacter sp. JSM 1782161]|uniref:DUF302 domain-containing protein n=1 Tax=Marinobacter sp. JSM 1782161 TaxID=2685906 RepID=UPI0014023C9C|nr:DUF302 domain-containing protein [Marinobacter sp. JSM 1782161]
MPRPFVILACLVAPLLLALSSHTLAADGLITVQSPHSVETTADNLEAVLDAKGMTVFTRIDHALGAREAGLDLRPTEVVIFGNPKVGTPLMQCTQSVAIDLPQKALIWQDAEGQVWVGYNDPQYLKERHDIEGCDEVVGKIEKALGALVGAAVE